MKRYEILYWFGSITTSVYVTATSKQDAVDKFHEVKGCQAEVISVAEVG